MKFLNFLSVYLLSTVASKSPQHFSVSKKKWVYRQKHLVQLVRVHYPCHFQHLHHQNYFKQEAQLVLALEVRHLEGQAVGLVDKLHIQH